MRAIVGSLIASLIVLAGCGGASKSVPNATPLTNNWQFAFGNPATDTQLFSGGFFLQKGNSVTGSVNYSITSADGSQTCTGAAPFTGNVSGSQVSLSTAAGGQAFTFTGTVATNSSGNSVMSGAWTSSTGGCGTSQTGQWTAQSVPPLTGSFQGSLHSSGNAEAMDVDFPITGSLSQGNNIGSSSATLTGTLSAAGYPCLTKATLSGQISGNSVILNIIGSGGLNNGLIGNPNPIQGGAQFDATNNMVHGTYTVDTKACSAAIANADAGNVCLGLGLGTACMEPVVLSPNSIQFPQQIVGGQPVSQVITLMNQSSSAQSGLNLSLFGPTSDFNGQAILAETDNCGGPNFSLAPQQSCMITVTYTPLESCPWDPTLNSTLPARCPLPQAVPLDLFGVTPPTWDLVSTYAAQVSGSAQSAVVPSVPELDFGWQTIGVTGPPLSVTFTNQGPSPVTILTPIGQPCSNPYPYTYPPTPGMVPGLQVINLQGQGGAPPFGACATDSTTLNPIFPITADGCSGQTLMPLGSCTVSIAFSPQAMSEPFPTNGDFYFLELNTLGEPDSGRFPLEVKTTQPNVLRMSPAAGFNLGNQAVGTTSAAQTVTLTNSSTAAVAFPAPFFVSNTDYLETNNCGTSLGAGASCVVSFTFTPSHTGYDPATITITTDATSGSQQVVYLRGTGQ